MNFTSTLFIFLFLPLTLIFYYISPNKIKNFILLVASFIFYSFGSLDILLTLISTLCINYIFAFLLAHSWKCPIAKPISAVCMLLWNIGLLFHFKYLSSVLNFANNIFNMNFSITEIIFPIGISFFTFRCISYCLDVLWEITPPQDKFMDLALYVSFFPQLLMGPITKYHDFEPQLKNRALKIDNICEGVKRIILGLTKKLFIANRIGIMVDTVFSMNSSKRSVILAIFAVLGYLIQLYYDFSGYSDIAIGLGNLFGFKTPENFKYPYASKSIIEFWNRWHITLGDWFKEYVFTPLFRFFQLHNIPFKYCNYLSLFWVWLLVGIWHGVGIKFAIYGLYYFIFILFERIMNKLKKDKKKKEKTFKSLFVSHLYFFVVVFFGQLLFRTNDLQSFWHYIKDLFAINGNDLYNSLATYYISKYWLTLIIGIIFSFPLIPHLANLCNKNKILHNTMNCAKVISYCSMTIISIAYIMADTSQSFIYFQF